MPDPFTDEDRARVQMLIDAAAMPGAPESIDTLTRALALLDRLQAYEEALQRIERDDPYEGPEVPARAIARATLKGEDE